ncbi:MAG: formyltetrahydrofolate deformylase [Steroidobacteraceae bacterium]
MTDASYILTTSTPDTTGIVAAITGFLAARRLSITETQHFLDPPTSRSYLRTVFRDGGGGLPPIGVLAADFKPIAKRFGMQWQFRDAGRRCRVLIGVSKQGQCLNSMLNRWHSGVLPIDVIGVYSNHEDQKRLTDWYGVPYHWFPIGPQGKAAQEAQILELFDGSGADLMVLARYMQILSAEACDRLAGRAINIHHSFLPGFKGARPYYQAYERGVKLIGATAHYVTGDLDEGPIIEQEVHRVDHTLEPEELTNIGHDIESVTLNRAVRWHAEHRVFVHGNRTVVLR